VSLGMPVSVAVGFLEMVNCRLFLAFERVMPRKLIILQNSSSIVNYNESAKVLNSIKISWIFVVLVCYIIKISLT
jgi:hypothetical protein